MCHPSFWDFKIGDLINSIIAATGVALAYYVFVYKRKKDTNDKKELLDQLRQTARIEWFKLLIIEPNIDAIHTFFSDIEKVIERILITPINTDYLIEYSVYVDDKFNRFERKFIETLDAIDPILSEKIIHAIDDLRDYIKERIPYEPLSTDKGKLMRGKFRKSKNDFLKALY